MIILKVFEQKPIYHEELNKLEKSIPIQKEQKENLLNQAKGKSKEIMK